MLCCLYLVVFPCLLQSACAGIPSNGTAEVACNVSVVNSLPSYDPNWQPREKTTVPTEKQTIRQTTDNPKVVWSYGAGGRRIKSLIQDHVSLILIN